MSVRRKITARALVTSHLASFSNRRDVWAQLSDQPSANIQFREVDGEFDHIEIEFPSERAAETFDRRLMTFGVFCQDEDDHSIPAPVDSVLCH